MTKRTERKKEIGIVRGNETYIWGVKKGRGTKVHKRTRVGSMSEGSTRRFLLYTYLVSMPRPPVSSVGRFLS